MDLEELAFKNVTELTELSKEELLMIIALLQQDRKCWINQFTKTHNDSVGIQLRINKAIEVLKLCNSQCSKEVIEILKGGSND